MTRVRADDYGDKRRAILDMAAMLFAKIGYANAKMVDIGRECGASKSMLYHYFPAKEDVLFELTREYAQGHLTAMEEVLSRKAPADQRLKEFVAMWVRRSLASRGRHTVLMYDLKFLPKSQQRLILEIERRMRDLLAEFIGELSPALRKSGPHHLKVYALLVFGLLNSPDSWYQSGGPLGVDELADRMFRLAMHGLKAERQD